MNHMYSCLALLLCNCDRRLVLQEMRRQMMVIVCEAEVGNRAFSSSPKVSYWPMRSKEHSSVPDLCTTIPLVNGNPSWRHSMIGRQNASSGLRSFQSGPATMLISPSWLSPRLMRRCWLVNLPQTRNQRKEGTSAGVDHVEIIAALTSTSDKEGDVIEFGDGSRTQIAGRSYEHNWN